MNRIWFKVLFFSSLLAALFAQQANAQVVASGMTGTVTSADGKPIAGAVVTAIHEPTNTTFTATTGANGRFSFRGMPVGGPYKVTATASDQQIEPLTDVQTSLGEDTAVVLVATTEVVKLEKFVATASRSDLDANATGASTVLSNRRISIQPTVNRSFTDMMKTNPFVSVRAYPQVTALGMNNRYNSITLDGAKINDSFGLANSGLFSAFNPFSIDAVEQFSVSLTPYDVRQSGSVGAYINAVSKSGTNEFHGTVYDLFTDQNWQGPDEFGPNIHKRVALKERTYGFTLGGPILKDKLFFFVNWEKFIQDSAPRLPGFTPSSDFISSVRDKMSSFSGAPDIGTFGAASTSRKSDQKRLAKIDWNISQDHRLTVRYSDTTSSQPDFGSFNYSAFSQPSTFTQQNTYFTSSGSGTGTSSAFYNLNIKEKVWATQLFSSWTPEFKTEIDYSNTKQDSVRSVPVTFPEIRIFNVPGTATTGGSIASNDAFRFGSEISSMGNELHVKTQTATASGDYTWRDFTFSGGADWEASDFFNLFRQGSYGYFDYANLAAFKADTPFAFGRAVVQDGTPSADISKFKRTGVFGQAKWEPLPRLTLIAGVRADFVGSPIAPTENTNFKNTFGITNAGTVDGTSSLQPRLSFNYALDRQRMTQVRGGYGIFLGRNPWVWISNSYGNTGVGRTNISATTKVPTLTQYLNGTYTNADSAYKFDPASPIGKTSLPPSAGASTIALVKPGMKLPTISRGNVAVDRKLPFMDSTISIEYIETEQLDALFVDNMNLKPTTKGADGRQRFGGAMTSSFSQVIRTRDVHAGKSQYASIMLDHPMKNHWEYSLAYTHGHATDTQGMGSSTPGSQWNFNNVFNQNTVEVSRSDFEIRHRVQLSLAREFEFVKRAKTTVAIYYEGRSGQPYSYVYTGDLNGDTRTANDLIAVPTGTSDTRFDFSGMTAAQQAAYFAFIDSSGLKRYAGSYAPRNAFLGPWQNRLDLNFRQEIPVSSVLGHNVQLECFLDFINFGSWLNKKWFSYVEELNTSTTSSNQLRALGNATYTTTGLIKPTVTLNPDGTVNFGSSSLFVVNNADTRWKVQAGVKLKF